MKLPSSVGQKKTKAIEHLLDELGIPIQPMPTDEICQLYNDLRYDFIGHQNHNQIISPENIVGK